MIRFANHSQFYGSSGIPGTNISHDPVFIGGVIRTEGDVGMSANEMLRTAGIGVYIPSIGFIVSCDLDYLMSQF